MRTAVICHGTMGSPDGNWFPWLAAALEQKGWRVDVPLLPTPENQTPEQWKRALAAVCSLSDIDALIGHSCGGTFLLHLLQDAAIKTRHSIFVGTVIGPLGLPEYDSLNAPFINRPFDWDAIRRHAGKISIFHGDDDPYVPLEHARALSRHLRVNLRIVKNGGHLNAESGYTAFPEIQELLEP